MIVRPKRIYRKRIPYGMQNFEDVIKEDCYYVDKTPFIEQIEESNKYFFYIRPRRFGKTLTLSMLENYYDINKKDKFDEIFGKLYIGQNPTPEHNTYLIIHLNFAEVAAGLDDYKDGLDNHCRLVFNFFCDIYAHILPAGTKEGLQQEPDAVSKLRFLCQKCQEVGKKIYLFIDEYDNFTNMILAHEEHLVRYRNQTHGEGYLRQFFNTIKGAAGNTLGRVFVTGVSPVTMDDLTSGFNIGTNYSLSPKFNEMTGFTEEEVREMLDYYRSVLPFNHTTDELIKVMKPWYDNYCFAVKSYGKTTMYNSVMVLNFISNYIDNEYDIPDSMVETNIRIDYDKLRMLIRHDKEFAHDASIIRELKEAGFDDCLFKPFSTEKLREILGLEDAASETEEIAEETRDTASAEDITEKTNKNSRFAPLLTFAEGDPEAEAEILSTVKQELSSHLQNLQQATEGELSIEAIGKTAHKLLPIATMIEMETRQHIAALAPEHISDLSESQIRAYTQAVIADLKGLLKVKK